MGHCAIGGAELGEKQTIATFQQPPDDEPLLEASPLVRGMRLTADYMTENGGIGLTKSGAFNRKFVHWAAAHFDWPEYSEADLFRLNKVLDEPDFPLVVDIHALLEGLQLGRRRKGAFTLNRAGRDLMASTGRLFAEVVPAYLFRINHAAHLRFETRLPGGWDVFLNVINVEAQYATTLSELRISLYGPCDQEVDRRDGVRSALYITVVRPLAWAGLVQIDPCGTTGRDYAIVKSELWRRCLRLDTDTHLRPRIVQ